MKHRHLLFLVPVLALSACGFEIVDTGNRGIETNFGKVVGDPLTEGIHFYNPFTSKITQISVREQKLSEKTECFTSDTQVVVIDFAMTFYPKQERIGELYRQFGSTYVDKIVKQKVLGSIKDAVGQYIADELVRSRDRVRTTAFKEMVASLAERNIVVTSLDFVNLDFDDAYERAVEQKVVAIQKAAEAKNKTVEVEEQAKQTVLSAKAEAESMKIKSQALAQNKGLVQFEAVQKWDGKLPVNMYGSAPMPFLNLKAGE